MRQFEPVALITQPPYSFAAYRDTEIDTETDLEGSKERGVAFWPPYVFVLRRWTQRNTSKNR